MSDERVKRGQEIINKVTGGIGASAVKAALPPKLAEYSLNFMFGELWAGDELSLQERSIVTCSALIAMDRQNGLKHHFAIARNLGVPREKIEGIITHLAAYAGWPCAVTAAFLLNDVWPKE